MAHVRRVSFHQCLWSAPGDGDWSACFCCASFLSHLLKEQVHSQSCRFSLEGYSGNSLADLKGGRVNCALQMPSHHESALMLMLRAQEPDTMCVRTRV